MLQQQSIASIIDQKQIQPHFQGLVDFNTEDYFAFESLVRVTPSIEHLRPDELFSIAESQGYLLELDRLCVLQSLQQFKQQKLPGLLFVNILPINLGRILSDLPIETKQASLKGVVFEISEKYPLPNFDELKEYIKTLRQHGALIAIDDLGSGHSGLITWAEIKPDFVKIDRHFIDTIHKDSIKREFVRSIIEIARGLRCKVIAEGIETLEELDILYHLGITLGQGFLLHRPEETPKKLFKNKRYFNLSSHSQQQLNIRRSETVESLLEYVEPIDGSVRADEVSDHFKQDTSLRCLPIVNGTNPVGIISRTRILEIFSGRYSYPLHGHKPILQLIDDYPVVVDHLETLHSVSQKITENSSHDLNSDFIITLDKQYYGVGRVNSLIKVLSNTQLQRARHSNPLTLLPGNMPIYEHIEDLISQQQLFHLAYVDINHFKPFNDYFGFSVGDEVIKRLSEIILERCSSKLDMVGHIGGDDFVIIFRSQDWQKKCEFILNDFQAFTLKFYSKEEIIQQGIWCQDRRGNQDFFHLLSLAIGVVSPEHTPWASHHEIAELATKAKKQAKKVTGNYLYVSQTTSQGQLEGAPLH